MYLLDTNVIAELAKNPRGPTAKRLSALSEGEFGINPIIASEIEYGLMKRGSRRLREHIEAILSAIVVFDLPSNIAEHYGRIRLELERQGTPIGPNDLVIAAHASASNLVLITNNEREFRRVSSITVESWIV